MQNDKHSYDDIVNLPHPESDSHPRMPLHDRAAQFSPFAALTGYEDEIAETARLTFHRIELDDTAIYVLNEKLRIIQKKIKDRPFITVTYFLPDERKAGGEYSTMGGNVKKIDESARVMIFTNNDKIPIDDIIEISGEIFM